MDKEEFQAWKDSPATQWVLAYLKRVSERMDKGLKERLSLSPTLDPQEWAALQPMAALDAGYLKALRLIIDLEYEQTQEND